MNEKLWKTIQYASIFLTVVIAIVMLSIADYEHRPEGGWDATFPNKGIQYTALCLLIFLTPVIVFSTHVRIEKEVSLYVLLRTIISIVVWFGLAYFSRYVLV